MTTKVLFGRILSKGGLQVVDAEHGVEALSRLEEHKDISLILSDINMPEMDGFALVNKINDENLAPNIPIIFVSTETSQKTIDKAKALGVVAFVIKPASPPNLLKIVWGTLTKFNPELEHNSGTEKNNLPGYKLVYCGEKKDIRTSIKNALKQGSINFTLLESNGFNDVLDQIARHQVDAILIEKFEKDSKCEEVLKKLQDEKYFPPTIAITNDNSLDFKTSLFKLGIVEIVKKSEIGDKLPTFLETIIKRSRAKISLMEERTLALQKYRQKTLYFSNISHEIRNSLNIIMGISQITSEKLQATEFKYINTLNQASDSLNRLLSDVMDISKIETGNLELHNRKFNLFHLLSSLEQSINLKITNKDDAIFVLEINNNVPQFVKGDSDRLNQILINLLTNSVKFIRKGEVKLEVRLNSSEKNEVIFIVSDTGPGIKEEAIDQIFHPYIQEDKTIYSKHTGNGLGLAICKNLVELMKGRIWLESELNKGTSFYFTVPFMQADQKNSSKEIAKVLILDDDEEFLNIVAGVLEDLNTNVSTCNNPQDAFKMVLHEDYDLIIIDMILPKTTGMEFIKKIRMETELVIPFILISGHEEANLRKMVNLKEIVFIPKPITDLNDFENRIKQSIEIGIFYRHNRALQRKIRSMKSMKILLADDAPENHMIIKAMLSNPIFNIEYVQNGKEAIDKIKENYYDFLIIDINMPVLSGLETVKKIRALEKRKKKKEKLKIFILTGNSHSTEIEKAYKAGCDGYLTKPILKESLIDCISKNVKSS